MLKIGKQMIDSMRAQKIVELKRDVTDHVRRKIALKAPYDERVMSERLERAFEQAHTFLSTHETNHYDSYVYLTLSFFLIDKSVSDPAIHSWLGNDLISPITRARTLYMLVKKTLKEGH